MKKLQKNLEGIKKTRRNAHDYIVLLLIVTTLSMYDIKPIFLFFQLIAFSYSASIIGKNLSHTKRSFFIFFVWIILFGGYAGLSFFWSSSINKTVISTTMSIFQAGGIATCIVIYAGSEHRISRVIDAIIVAAVVLSLRFFINVPRVYWGNMMRFSRSASIFGGNGPAMILSYTSVIIFWRIQISMKNSNRVLLIIAYITIILFVFISLLMGTKQGILLFLIGVSIILVGKSNAGQSLIIRLILFSVILITIYYLIMNIPLLYSAIGYRFEALNNFFLGKDTDGSTRARYAFVQSALDVFFEHPIIGIGQDGFRYINPYETTYSHNNYTELMSNLGLVGLSLYYVMPLRILRQTWVVRQINVLPLALISSILIIDFASVSYSTEYIYVFLSLSLSILHALPDQALNTNWRKNLR